MNENYKLTKELNDIMEEARNFTASNMSTSISTESVVYFIAKRYTEAKKKSDVECDILLPIFKGIPADAQQDLVNDLAREALDYCNSDKYPSPSLYNSETIILCDDLDRAFKRAKIEMSLDISYSKMMSKGEEISTIELFISILSEQTYLTDILGDYRITKEAILTSYIAKSEAERMINSTPDSSLGSMFNALTSIFDELSKDSLGSKQENTKQSQPKPEDSISDDEDFERAGKTDGAISPKKVDPESKTPTLDEFAFDMTKAALDSKYDPVVGRDKELGQIIEILSCRKKNNAILLGDPGSGKTALVELLAQRIASSNVPRELQNRRVLSLSTTDLTAGTQYRGQLEERVQCLCKELSENRDIILYIDEFQQATSDSSTSIAQMLKPSLGRGEITLIASTTTDEYRKFIEKDGALKRRFSPVQVEEPGVEETIEILKGIAPRYSEFHKIAYDPDVLIKCAEWSGKYINDRFFPDKAISVLDMAFSLAKLRNPSDTTKLKKLKKDVLGMQEEKIKLTLDLKLDEAEAIRKNEEKAAKKLMKEQDVVNRVDPKTWPTLGISEVSEVISKLSGVPIDKIMSSDMTKLREIKTSLSSKVIGQDEAIEQLTLALQRNVLGLRNADKPIASFLLVGPTGVGKALKNGTPVLTDKGWVNIEKIKVGDLVATPYNGFSKVNGVYPQGKKDTVYKLTFKDGRTIETDENHLWQVRTEKQQKLFRKSSGSNTRHSYVMSTKDLYEQLKVSNKGGTGKSFKYGIPLHEVYNSEKDYLIPPYVMGVLLGDGCLTESKNRTRTLQISSDEEDIIKKCADLLKCSYKIHKSYNYTNTLKGDIIKAVNKYIRDTGLACRAMYKFIPDEYLMGSIDQRKELLKGLIDTDGYIDNKGRFRISTGSARLKDSILELCRSLGYVATVIDDIRVGRNPNYNIHIWTHDKIFNSKRREEQYDGAKKGDRTYWNDRLPIVSIEKFEHANAETTCIAIEDEDKLFITKDYLVTHNTLVSKVLAEEFMGSDKSLITIACSEYMQDWAESKLLGSAPGYVGFSDSEPRLYVLKRKPYSVLLIDEVEKSSSNLYNIWLNMLEEGEITLSSGEKVSCRNTIIIFTGNVGTKNLELYGNGMGFTTPGKEEKKKKDLSIVMKEVKKEFRPEFLNRLTKVVVFNSLGTDELNKIFYLELKKLQDRLKVSGYTLKVSDKIKDLIVSKCEPEYGARSLQRLITTYIEDEVCKSMLDSEISGKTLIEVDLLKDDEVKVEFK